MTRPDVRRRRAADLARALDRAGRSAGSRRPDGARPDQRPRPAGTTTADLVALSAALSAAAPRLDDAARQRMRRRMVAMATVRANGVEVPLPRPRGETGSAGAGRERVRRLTRRSAALLLVVVVGVLGAAQRAALPGDTLYGLKLSLENARLALATSDEQRGTLHLHYAAQRLQEAGDLLHRPDALLLPDTGPVLAAGSTPSPRTVRLVTRTLDAMDADNTAATRELTTAWVNGRGEHPLTLLQASIGSQAAQVRRLLPDVPGEVQADVRASLGLLRVAHLGAVRMSTKSSTCGGDQRCRQYIGAQVAHRVSTVSTDPGLALQAVTHPGQVLALPSPSPTPAGSTATAGSSPADTGGPAAGAPAPAGTGDGNGVPDPDPSTGPTGGGDPAGSAPAPSSGPTTPPATIPDPTQTTPPADPPASPSPSDLPSSPAATDVPSSGDGSSGPGVDSAAAHADTGSAGSSPADTADAG